MIYWGSVTISLTYMILLRTFFFGSLLILRLFTSVFHFTQAHDKEVAERRVPPTHKLTPAVATSSTAWNRYSVAG